MVGVQNKFMILLQFLNSFNFISRNSVNENWVLQFFFWLKKLEVRIGEVKSVYVVTVCIGITLPSYRIWCYFCILQFNNVVLFAIAMRVVFTVQCI